MLFDGKNNRIPPYIFLRDDDVWSDDDIFLELLSFLKELSVPVIYGVIPARLEPQMVAVLSRAKRENPDLLDIAQHGFQHVNYANDGASKYEFGAGRNYDEQYQDMQEGQKLLQGAFGSLLTPAFIPPYHGFDGVTLDIVDKLGFQVFSAGKKVGFLREFIFDLPARVALNEYRSNGVPMVFDSRQMLLRLRRELLVGGIIGLVYHHRAIRHVSDMKALKLLLRYLAGLRDRGVVRCCLFSDILRLRKYGG